MSIQCDIGAPLIAADRLVDYRLLVPEPLEVIRRLKAEICTTAIRNNERLSNNECAGDFALRYTIMVLLRNRHIRQTQRGRARRRQRRTPRDNR